MLDRPLPGIRRLLAPNPSPMTGPGTNGYIIGEGTVAIVDPGPDDARHLGAWLDALRGEEVSHILVTHAHLDHSALASRLSAAFRAPVLGFGPWDSGRSATMRRLARLDGLGGGEGIDRGFAPDRELRDGDRVEGPGWRLEVLHTPGHFSGHLAFRAGTTILSGDHVLGWSSTLISPPDGDLRQFLATCARMRGLGSSTLLPGHGDPVADPEARLDWLVEHRRVRETQIVASLAAGLSAIAEIVPSLYADVPAALRHAASRNVLAHLVALVEEDRVVADPEPGPAARYRLT